MLRAAPGGGLLVECSDEEVRDFVLIEMWDIGIYRQPEFVLTADQLVDQARRRFGPRCDDLEFWVH